MNALTESFNVFEDIGVNNNPLSSNLNIPTQWLVDKFLSLAELIIEFIFGMHVGAAFGYIAGKIAVMVYTRYAGHMSFSEAETWRIIPFSFGIYGAVAGFNIMTILIVRRYIRRIQSFERKDKAA